MSFHRLDDNTFVIKGKEDVLVYFRSGDEYSSVHQRPKPQIKYSNLDDLVTWGTDNCEPYELLRLVTGNNLNPALLKTKRNFWVGKEILPLRREIVDGKVKQVLTLLPEFDTFALLTGLQEEIDRCAYDLAIFGTFFIEYLFDENGKIISLRHIDASQVRCGAYNTATRRPKHYYICADWRKKNEVVFGSENPDDDTVSLVWAYDPQNPTRFDKCIYQGLDYEPDRPYYGLPDWIGCVNYIELANRIPEFHAKMLENGFNIKYHIQIPSNAFNSVDEKDRPAAKQKMLDDISAVLRGSENAGNSLVTEYNHTEDRLRSEWLITAIPNELKDDAYVGLFDATNEAIISGHGLPPELANIQTAGKLSSGSASRNAYLLYLILHCARPRRLLLKVVNIIHQNNGWELGITYAFQDVELTTLDENPTATQNVVQ